MSLPILPSIVEAIPADGSGPRNYGVNYIFFWNGIALDLVRLTHTVGGFQGGPPLTARFLGIFHLAMHDAYFATFPYDQHSDRNHAFDADMMPYLDSATVQAQRPADPNLPASSTEAKEAVAGAAITVFDKLFKNPDKRDPGVSLQAASTLGGFLDASVRSYQQVHGLNTRSPAYAFGVAIARQILQLLEVKASEPGVDAGDYRPNADNPYWFDDEPSHPVRLRPTDVNDPEDGERATRPYHGPLYGSTATIFAVTEDIQSAAPPLDPRTPPDPKATSRSPAHLEYLDSVEDVHRMGGAEELSTTKRRPIQTALGLFWAYDGVNLIGTPPRLYNQIIRQIAFDRRANQTVLGSDQNNAEILRLLTLVNVAMADAGIFSWRDKYKYELWRPLSGVRGDPTGPVPNGHGRPTWRVLGAPATNSNEGGFKPPFPAYPSGHATFGAAAFQMARLFYHQRKDWGFVHTPGQTQDQSSVSDFDLNVSEDDISFEFISDELNGISRTLYQPYRPSVSIQDQPGDVRTRLPMPFASLKEAIFSNAISRIWLGVHWIFDGFAGETVLEKFYRSADANAEPKKGGNRDELQPCGEETCADPEGRPKVGEDRSQPRPSNYQQQFQVEGDGSTKYQEVAAMKWIKVNEDGTEILVGGVPLGEFLWLPSSAA